MKINLFRISPDGDNYSISQDNKDVAEELSDLLGSEPSFQCDFSLKPLGDAIEVKGHFKGHSPQDCSFCGEGYPYPILIEFSEYLVPKEPPKKSQKQTSQEDELDQEDGLGVEFENFYPARFLRDRIGFALPFQVPCKTAVPLSTRNKIDDIALKRSGICWMLQGHLWGKERGVIMSIK